MAEDKRMYFVRNIEALKDGDAESRVIEYEVITDAHIIGELNYGPYYFTIWEFSDKKEGEKRKLCLRIREKAPSDDDQPWRFAKRTGFYHGGGIADELVALASLFLRRRFELGRVCRMDDLPRLISLRRGWVDERIVLGESNLGDLSAWLKLVEGLDSELHQKYILAVRLYHQAVLMIEGQPDFAYLMLVSAIETLCRDQEIGQVTLSDISPKLAALVGSVENEDLRVSLEKAILEREKFIARRFVAFILEHTEEDFWREEKRPEYGRIGPEELPELLKRIYDQRSKTLHEGEPFPPSVFHPPKMGAEIDFSLGMSVGERKWTPKDFIPHPHFFERLVNHVLKTFLKRHQSERS